MVQFIYFPCNSNGVIAKGFCPSIAEGSSMLRDIALYKKYKSKFGYTHYAFKFYDDSDLSGISFENLTIVKL